MVDQNLKASSFFNENRWAGSLVRIGRRPPKPPSTDFHQFERFVRSKYSKVYAETILRYVKKYSYLLENPVELDTFKKHKRSNVLKSLVAYAKFTGTYSEFKQRLKDYGIRWGKTTDSTGSFLRMMNNNGSDVLKWYREALQILRTNEQTLLKFVLVTGLRKSEAIQAFNLIIRLWEKNRLKEYYNEELQTLEHFRFRDLFLRKTKNAFISFVPKSLIEEIVNRSPVTYESIRKRLQRKHIPIRLMELRNHFATFMVRHGLIREEVDVLQGRIPANVFIRHYWTPSFQELGGRALRVVDLLEQVST